MYKEHERLRPPLPALTPTLAPPTRPNHLPPRMNIEKWKVITLFKMCDGTGISKLKDCENEQAEARQRRDEAGDGGRGVIEQK